MELTWAGSPHSKGAGQHRIFYAEPAVQAVVHLRSPWTSALTTPQSLRPGRALKLPGARSAPFRISVALLLSLATYGLRNIMTL